MASRPIINGKMNPAGSPYSYLDRWLALGSMLLLLAMNVALIGLKVGTIPIRGVLAIGLLAGFALLYPGATQRAIAKHTGVFVLAISLAALGTFVSLVNGTGVSDIFRAILEVHVQAIVTLSLATIAAQVAGPRASVAAIVAVVGASVLVAALQFAGLDAAWHLRSALGKIQGENMALNSSFLNHRPMGLSFSPIHLSTQICLAFAAYASLRSREQFARFGTDRADPAVILAIFALIGASIVIATRSPILGAAAMLAYYALRRRGALLPLLFIALAGTVALADQQILEMLQVPQARVVSVSDDSAVGRLALIKYGFMLLRDNPLGYGLDFSPSDHWMQYWRELYTFQSADDIKTKELHDYAINMLNSYGVGLLLVLPIAYGILKKSTNYLLYFVPYIVHTVFHNTGPFWNDSILWFVIGAISGITAGTGRSAQQTPMQRA